MDELYRRLQPEMRRPKPSADAIAAALEAAQRLAAEADAEQAADDSAQDLSSDPTIVCAVCGYRNRQGNKFCGMCGMVVTGPIMSRIRRSAIRSSTRTRSPTVVRSHHSI